VCGYLNHTKCSGGGFTDFVWMWNLFIFFVSLLMALNTLSQVCVCVCVHSLSPTMGVTTHTILIHVLTVKAQSLEDRRRDCTAVAPAQRVNYTAKQYIRRLEVII